MDILDQICVARLYDNRLNPAIEIGPELREREGERDVYIHIHIYYSTTIRIESAPPIHSNATSSYLCMYIYL